MIGPHRMASASSTRPFNARTGGQRAPRVPTRRRPARCPMPAPMSPFRRLRRQVQRPLPSISTRILPLLQPPPPLSAAHAMPRAKLMGSARSPRQGAARTTEEAVVADSRGAARHPAVRPAPFSRRAKCAAHRPPEEGLRRGYSAAGMPAVGRVIGGRLEKQSKEGCREGCKGKGSERGLCVPRRFSERRTSGCGSKHGSGQRAGTWSRSLPQTGRRCQRWLKERRRS